MPLVLTEVGLIAACDAVKSFCHMVETVIINTDPAVRKQQTELLLEAGKPWLALGKWLNSQLGVE